jgi:molybdenum cofactor cytidylyltransferase
MKFGPVSLDDALGKINGHNIAGPDGRRLIRKGKVLTQEQLAALRAAGRTRVYVAELEPGDLDEDSAAGRCAEAVMGSGLRMSGPTVGRTVATIKIIPYAIEDIVMREVEATTAGGPLLRVDELATWPVSLVFTGSPSIREKLEREFEPLVERVRALGSYIAGIDYVSLEDEEAEVALAGTLRRRQADDARLIILAGETTIMDRDDIVPRAITLAGGRVERLGAPVDPGNLFMLAYLDDTPVLGAPGCARSRKPNITDWALPRLLVGDHLTNADIVALGHGGLLDDASER